MIWIKLIIWISGCMLGLKLYKGFSLFRGKDINAFAIDNIYRWLGRLLILVFAITSIQGYSLVFSILPVEIALCNVMGLTAVTILLFVGAVFPLRYFFIEWPSNMQHGSK